MKAARYVGRVGGLAVALGVGTAVFTGYGVASAETGSDSSGSSSASSSASGSSGADDSSGSAASGAADPSDSSGAAGTSDAGSADTSDVDDDSAAADDADLSDDLADQLADEALDDLDDDPADEADASGSGGTGSSDSDDADLAEAITDLDDAEDAVDDDSSASAVVSLASATSNPATDEETPAPAAPPVDLMLAAATRREATDEPTAAATSPEQAAADVTSAGLFGNPINVTLVPATLDDGNLLGVIEAFSDRGFELRYTIVDEPTDGSKTTLINSTQCEQITTCSDAFPGAPADSGDYTLLPYLSVLQSGGTSTFDVLISEVTPFDAALQDFLGDTLGPLLVPRLMNFLQQVPILGDLLAPVIGYSVKQTVSVDVGELIPDPDNTPAAFTVKIPSVADALISTNYFPASGLAAGDPPAPTILNGPGLGASGNITPYSEWTITGLVPGVDPVRAEGYNYVSWDPRGEHASTGILQLDNPFFEGRDVMHIIDYLVKENLTATEGTTPSGAPDPLIGMIGGSYGGGIQLVVAGIDQRVDAIVPGIAWNSLNEAIYPEDAFKTAWANLLYTDLVVTGARINSQIPPAILTGNLFGTISESAQAVLASSGPTVLVESITAPTLLIQGTADGLFVLQQASQNAAILSANEIETKLIWYCGGHGVCLDPVNPNQDSVIVDSTFDWLSEHVKGGGIPALTPTFQWFNQDGQQLTSLLLPFEQGFSGPTLGSQNNGGFLPFLPLGIGGSGPSKDPHVLGPLRGATASEASNALNLPLEFSDAAQIAGTPEVNFTYSGFGNADFVYGQIVDDQTGLVLGNLVTPIPVTLDGQTRQASVQLESIAYTADPGDSLTFQLTSSASVYKSHGDFGWINVSDMIFTTPTVAADSVTLVSEGP